MSTEDLNTTLPAIDIEHTPARTTSILAAVAGLLAVLSSGLVSVLALAFGFLGLLGVVGGLFSLKSRRAVTIGSAVIFLAVLLSGLQGNSPPLLVFSTIATILTFDLGQNAFSLGDQMTKKTRTQRNELVHAASSTIVGSVVTLVAYLVYLVAGGGWPGSAIMFLLAGAILIVWAIRA